MKLNFLLITLFAFIACGKKKADEDGNATTPVSPIPADSQTPPLGAAALEPWLATTVYKSWNCEAKAHAIRSPSAHSINRICSNTLASKAGPGEYPVGAAAVKELYGTLDGAIIGYAVSLHVKAGTTGDTWYWYERAGTFTSADGLGDSKGAKASCVGCHSAAGSDADHSGHDFFYTQVK